MTKKKAKKAGPKGAKAKTQQVQKPPPPEPLLAPPQGPTVEELKAALAEHGSVAAAAESLKMTASNFQAKWMRRTRSSSPMTPGEYLASLGLGRAQGPSRTVNFRLPEYALLEEAAAEAGLSPSDHARELVRAALGRWLKKRHKNAV